MGAHNYPELKAWQLANELKLAIYEVCDRPAVARDARYCDQIRHAASSVCFNIAEGFGRFAPRDFARFLMIARGSLCETQNELEDGRDRRHVTEEEFTRLWELSERARTAIGGLIKYLRTNPKV